MDNHRRDGGARLRALASAAYTASAGHLEIEPEEPTAPARKRWLPTLRSALIAGAVVVVLGLTVALAAWWNAPGAPEPLPPPGEAAPSEARTAPGVGDEPAAEPSEPPAEQPAEQPAGEPDPTGTAGTVVVHVAGAVTDPGVVELDAGARVADAVERAGGATPEADLGTVNLARVLTDGEQVYVPAVGEDPPATGADTPAGGSAGGSGDGGEPTPVNLNTAGPAELEELPGIGPALATAVLEWRETNGGFASVDDLELVSGIGPATMERLRPLVTV
ncbi:helix-hairpin-helix domain-containing protein [Georgenia deserti]|uniref:Helix-hairpin-helix domain-containing protein n=1 Tax=Georgenia deserti TaxID=2093781 RepID=A0ABW4LBC5_9MICO